MASHGTEERLESTLFLTAHVDLQVPNNQRVANRHDRITGEHLPQPRWFFGTWRDRNGAMNGNAMLQQRASHCFQFHTILWSNPCWDTAAFGERVEQGH